MRLVIALSLLVASSFAQDEPDIFHAIKAITTKRLSPRYAHGSAAYNGLVCVFGGFSDTNATVALNDTWLYSAVSSVWIQLDEHNVEHTSAAEALLSPPPVGFASFEPVRDPRQNTTTDEPPIVGILFGGLGAVDMDSPELSPVNGDLWIFSFLSLKWTPINPLSSLRPAARFAHTCTTTDDTLTDKTLMFCFGGRTANGTVFGDLWQFSLASYEWTELWSVPSLSFPPFVKFPFTIPGSPCLTVPANTTRDAPAPRFLHISFNLPSHPEGVFIAGGQSQCGGGCFVNGANLADGECFDTWMYNVTRRSWTQVRSESTEFLLYLPTSCTGMQAQVGNVGDSSGPIYSALVEGASRYSITDIVMVFSSNFSLSYSDDILLGSWTIVSRYMSINRRHRRFDSLVVVSFAAQHDTDIHLVSIAGETVSTPYVSLDDSWAIAEDSSINSWVDVSPPATAPPFYDTNGVLIQDTYYYVFGGQSTQTPISGTFWRLDLKLREWSHVVINFLDFSIRTISPPEMIGQSLTPYGGQNNALLLFGGAFPPRGVVYNEVYAFNLTSAPSGGEAWSVLDTGQNKGLPQPSGRYRHAAFACGVLRLCVFGGVGVHKTLPDDSYPTFQSTNDTWLLIGDPQAPFLRATWMRIALNSSETPLSRSQAAVTQRDRCGYLYGGLDIVGNPLDDLWSLCYDGENNTTFTWRKLLSHPHSASNPPPLFAATLFLMGSKLVLYGGGTQTNAGSPVIGYYLFTYNLETSFWNITTNTPAKDSIIDAYPEAPVGSIGMMLVQTDEGSRTVTIYGGINALHDSDYIPGAVGTLTLSCSPGFYSSDYLTRDCLPCPIGTFLSGEDPDARNCTHCPYKLTTPFSGSTSVNNCTRCALDACNNQGSCTINKDKVIQCDCKFPYKWSNGCETPWQGILIAAVVCLVAIVVTVVKYIHTRRHAESERAARAEADQLVRKLTNKVSLADSMNIREKELRHKILLDEGGASKVYRATLRGEFVVVKYLRLLHLDNDDDHVVRQGFTEEAQLLRAVLHPNIVNFIACSTAEQDGHTVPYIIVEYLELGSLHKLLVERTDLELSWKQRTRFMLDAARGVACLHRRGIVHCDIKSLNLLVASDFTVKVADLGAARMWHLYEKHRGPVRVPQVSGRSTSTTMRRGHYHEMEEPLLARTVESYTSIDVATTDHEAGRDEDTAQAMPVRATSIHDKTLSKAMAEQIFSELWRAPETYARGYVAELPVDVYAFGVTMSEVAMRALPYDDIPDDQLYLIRDLVLNGTRPDLGDAVLRRYWPTGYEELMRRCWAERPEDRPVFRDIEDDMEIIVRRVGM